jgi:hypothetical protein
MRTNSHPLLSLAYDLLLILLVSLSLVSLPAKLNAQGLATHEALVTSEYLSASLGNPKRDVAARADGVEVSIAKHMPNNAVATSYTEEMATTDRILAIIFGGPGAVAAANGFEPPKLAHQYPLYRGDLVASDGRILRGHLSYAMHLYGSEDGTAETEVYVPLGFTTHSKAPSPIDAVVTFYYPRLGTLTDVTLAIFHVADFGLRAEGERVRIGNIGGRGGSIASYKHSHLEFYRGNTGLPPCGSRLNLRIDPATVFGSTMETAVQAKAVASSRGHN